MPGTGKTTVASIFAKLLSASGSRAGHNFLSLTAHDALRMGPAAFSQQLSTLTGKAAVAGPPPGKRVGSSIEVQNTADSKW